MINYDTLFILFQDPIFRRKDLNIRDLIEYALKCEQRDQEEYSRYMKKTDRQGLKNLLSSLISQEKEHERQLREVLEDPVIEQAFTKSNQDVDESRFAPDTDFDEGMNYNDLLTLIMDREDKAVQLYQFIAAATDYDEIKYFFENLSSEEKKHKSWTVSRYELEMLSSF